MKTFGIILLIMLVIFGLGAKAFLDHASPEHEHSYGEWTTKTPATCTEAGVEVRACECNDEETREIPATGHTYGEWETKTPANCTDAEVEARKCACGAEETREGDAATGHSFGEWQTRTEPDCDDAGEEFRACACGAEETNVLAATGHTFGEWETKTPANCTDAEVEVRKCACGAEETREGDAANGHSFGAWQTRTEPTCESAGEEFRACACGAEETNVLAATGHTFGEWETKTPANCTDAEVEVRKCACGAEETREGDAATGHTYTSISATYNKESAMEHDVVSASDFTVTATCGCDYSTAVTEGITLENNTLALGDNTVTVKFGDLSTTVTLNAVEFNKVVNGSVVDDTYVYSASGSQDKNYVSQPELSANGDNFRIIFKYNFNSIINSQFYADHKDEAKVQFVYTVTTGSVNNDTKLTFKIYPVSDVRGSADFKELTWKTYDANYQFGWGKADGFVNKDAGDPDVTISENKIIITLTYREIEKYIDADGNLFAVFAIWKSGTKIGSMENEDENVHPSVSAIFDHNHRHAFIEEVVDEKYLASANCEEQAKYYVSCSCGEASTQTFAHGEVIEHSYGDWQTRTEATCTDAEVEFRKCACGAEETQTGDAALNHNMETKFDETNHWTECSRCDEATEPVAHFGGEATETEQATCEGCEQKYGGLASHVHQFGDWQTRTEATCTDAEVEFRKCTCGAEETQTGDAALNHNMETKFDADNHWTKCSRCDEATDPVAHFGGEATETEKAVCEGCGQSYGELKEAPKQEYIVNGTVLQDNYVNTSSNGTDYSHKKYLGTDANSVRSYLKIDFSDILKAVEEDGIAYSDAKIHVILTACKNPDKSYVLNTFTSDATITFAGFIPGDTTTGMDISNTETKAFTATNVKASDLYWDKSNTKLVTLLSGKKQSQEPDHIAISEDGLTLTITFTLQELMDQGLIGQDGLGIFTFRCGGMTDKVVVASLENTGAAGPAVKCEYYK